MKKSLIKTVCVLLCAVLALGPAGFAFSAVAAGTGGQLSETASWTFNNGRLTVTGTGDIPGRALFSALDPVREQITEAVVENGITDLGFRAFSGCAALTKVTLPATLKLLAADCFSFCTALKTVNVPEGVQLIDSGAFMYCTALESVGLPNSLHAIGDSAFQSCTALQNVQFPAALCSLAARAFNGAGLTSVVLPASVRCVGGWAFAQCQSLKNAILSSGLRFLPDCMFQNSALDYVVIPKSVVAAAEAAFYNCTLQKIFYEGTRQEFEQIAILNADGMPNVTGTSKLFETAEVKTAEVTTGLAAAKGDIDMKDGVTASDARDVLRAAVKLNPVAPATAEFYRADVDADGVITAADARTVLRGAVHLEDLANLQPQQPKKFTDAQLTALSGFKGTVRELINEYDAAGLTLCLSYAAAVFRGEKDTVVMLLDYNTGVFFCKRFTPTATDAQMEAVLRKENASYADVLAADPGLTNNIFQGLGGSVMKTSMSCTKEGRLYLFTFQNGIIDNYSTI